MDQRIEAMPGNVGDVGDIGIYKAGVMDCELIGNMCVPFWLEPVFVLHKKRWGTFGYYHSLTHTVLADWACC